VDAFIISLDPFTHPDAFDKTVEAGKPIFLEKPIAPTAERAYQMMKKAKEEKVPVHIGLVYRYNKSCSMIKEYLNRNDPGKIYSINYNWFQAVETEIINCQHLHPDNFRLKISQILFHCCHALDLFRFLGGEIKSVYANAIKYKKWNYVTPDEVIAMFEFLGGAIGEFHYSGFSYGISPGTLPGTIHAEKYSIEFSPWNKFMVWRRPAHKSERGENEPGDCRPTWNQYLSPEIYRLQNKMHNLSTAKTMIDFLNAVRKGTPMKVPIEEGYKVAEIAEAIEMSYKRREKIELPLHFE